MTAAILIKGVIAAQVQEQWAIASAGCHCLLNFLTADPHGSCQDELQEAGEAAYLLALKLCQQGQDQLAQPLLARLGCSYRLAPALLQPCSNRMSAANVHCLLDASLPCIFQQALPGHLFQQLQSGLDPSAAFWSDHNYFDPHTPFFSYLYDLASSPNTTIEAAIRALHPLLLQSPYGPCLAEAKCAEWWAHCREPEEPHQLHFDMREAALRQGLDKYRLDHPIISSVLFLTAAGGPTVVLDQSPSVDLADRGWVVQPCPNQLLAFEGNLLHGVIPGRRSVVSAAESCQEHATMKRITLIVAWWGPGIRAEPGTPGQGPCRTAPLGPCGTALCLKPKPNISAATQAAQSPDPSLLQAGHGLRAEPSHTALQDTPPPQAHQERSSSDSFATSAAESGSVPELEPAPTSPSCGTSGIPPESSALTDTESRYSQLLWLQQCQLLFYQQQAFCCPPQEGHILNASRLGDSAGEVGSSQPDSSSTTLLPWRKVDDTTGSQGTCHSYSSAKGCSDPCMVLPPAKGVHPPTISPVWLPVKGVPEEEEERCDEEDSRQGDQQKGEKDYQQDAQQDSWQHSQQDDQQDGEQDGQLDGQHNAENTGQGVQPLQQGIQPAAKRPKRDQYSCTDTVSDQQQLALPLAPLRFFLRSADEISSVYQPRKASAVSDEL